jgi:hypothetical protein
VLDAEDASGRAPGSVTIVAVTKTVGVSEIRDALAAGCRDFGENRVQEFVAKHGLFPDERWHFVGTLQSNKVQHVVGRAHLIHSVDSIPLLERIDRVAEAHGVVQRVLLQVNVSGEASKHGMEPAEAEEAMGVAARLTSVEVAGLMTIAPLARPSAVRWVFRSLADLFATLNAMRFNGDEMAELSMGMTNDFEAAVEEGATIIRVGRAIFGR